MKKNLFFSIVAATVLTACGTVVQPDRVAVNPSPLTLVGNSVKANITGTFPQKKFSKKAVLTITPVLKYEGGEVVGKSALYMGENARENGTVVSYANGGKYHQTVTFDYIPAMVKSELFLRFEASCGGKTVAIPEMKIADGVIVTATFATAQDVAPQITADKFQLVIQQVQEADILFLIQQSSLRNSETNSQAVKDLRAAIKDANKDEKKSINRLEVSGYASPDGSLDLNTNLAEKRQENSQRFLQQQLKKDKVQATIESSTTAEDWAGFQKAMEQSNIQDKELVLRVLSMYKDPEERETQIKNLSAVYKTIAEEILPALRRSRIILTTDLIGKSDDEIKVLAASDPAALNVEELLYAATLTNNSDEKLALYTKATELFPDDARAYNNIGMIYYSRNNIEQAHRCFANALAKDARNADINFNAGLVALAENDLDKAEQYLGKAAGTKGDLKAAMGTLYTMKGDYAAAKKAYGSEVSNNAAVQQILNEDYAAARQTLNKVENPNATTAYLLAIVGARTNDRNAVYSNLKAAIARDSSLKVKAAEDIEFSKFAQDEQFAAIVK